VSNSIVLVSIYDLKGVLLKQTNRNIVDVANLNSGVYLVMVKTKRDIVVKKMVVMKQ
jgi:hypothetical protein